MYKILLTKSAIKDLRKINQSDVILIGKKLEEYSKDPFSFTIKLSGKALSTYRFRIGHYRAIFDLDGQNIVIHRIAHRKDIYK
ncbi:MAG: type II toxin-antitoxin system RelE/ParE family toxin [Ignavibacteria bacterium]|nr:type II toxin-antitoxin system RelE/ParE family toxin [Ignavibacteria bacterium]